MLQKPGSSNLQQPRQKSARKLTKESPDDIVKRLQRTVPANKKCADCTTMVSKLSGLCLFQYVHMTVFAHHF
jgi:hypothetical protein